MPTSAPGSSPASAGAPVKAGRRHARRRRAAHGFTLIELLVVVALIAIASAIAAVSLRDPAAARLEQEAARLAALLESARAEARASGTAASWEPLAVQADGSAFRFNGAGVVTPLPTRWLDTATTAQVQGARAVVLGPEPIIGEQRIVLSLANQRLTLATDGIGPFVVTDSSAATP